MLWRRFVFQEGNEAKATLQTNNFNILSPDLNLIQNQWLDSEKKLHSIPMQPDRADAVWQGGWWKTAAYQRFIHILSRLELLPKVHLPNTDLEEVNTYTNKQFVSYICDLIHLGEICFYFDIKWSFSVDQCPKKEATLNLINAVNQQSMKTSTRVKKESS